MTDLEGISGVKGTSDSVGNKIVNDDEACRLLTEEVNAVIDGLSAGGTTEIIVMDGHGSSNSILIEHLRSPAKLINVGPGLTPVSYGMDSSFDAAIQIGQHAMMGTRDGFMNHTFNSHAVVNMRLNGELIGEIGIYALMAAYFSVPTILVSGDQAACREAKAFFGDIETVETKYSLNRYSAINRNPVEVRNELKNKAENVLRNLKKFKVKKLEAPFVMNLELMCPNMADMYQRQVGAKRINSTTIELKSDDFIDLWAQRNYWAPGAHKKCFEC